MKNIRLENLIEISLPSDENFLKVKETLTRIGIASKHDRKLYQSCHILHKKNRYFIVHFKEMFGLDGLEYNMNEDDIARRNRIAILLEEWGLVKILNRTNIGNLVSDMSSIKVIPFREKQNWTLIPKYHIGTIK
jgi:hypothetical protein